MNSLRSPNPFLPYGQHPAVKLITENSEQTRPLQSLEPEPISRGETRVIQENIKDSDTALCKSCSDASVPCLWWFTMTCAVSALTAPLLLTNLPPLGDYLNHLARMYVITQIDTDPVLARMYEVQWGVVPNLAMDLLVPPLSKIMPLTVAGRVFVALTVLLPLAGVVVLHRVSFQTRQLWPLSAVAVAYNGLFFWGLLNFVASMGVALLAVALWLRERDRSDWLHLAAAVVVG